MIDILIHLGCEVEKVKANHFKFKMNDIKNDVPASMASVVRASILFAGPLLARTGKVILPPPGGDVIGRRRLDTHFLALTSLGARVEIDGQFVITANKLVGVDMFFG